MAFVSNTVLRYDEVQKIRKPTLTEGLNQEVFVGSEDLEAQGYVSFEITHEGQGVAEFSTTCRMCGSIRSPSIRTRCSCCGFLHRDIVDDSVSTVPHRIPPTLAPVEIVLPEPPSNTVAAIHLWGNASRLAHPHDFNVLSSSSSSQRAPTPPVGRSSVLPAAVALALNWCSVSEIDTLRKASPTLAWACPNFNVRLAAIQLNHRSQHLNRPLSATAPTQLQSSTNSAALTSSPPSATKRGLREPTEGTSAQRQVLLRRRAALLRGSGSALAPAPSRRLQEWRQKQKQQGQQQQQQQQHHQQQNQHQHQLEQQEHDHVTNSSATYKPTRAQSRSFVGGCSELSPGPAKIGSVANVVETASVPALPTEHGTDATLSKEGVTAWAKHLVIELAVADSTGFLSSGVCSSSGAIGKRSELASSSASYSAPDESSSTTYGQGHKGRNTSSATSFQPTWVLTRTWTEAQALVRRLRFNIRRLPGLPQLPPLPVLLQATQELKRQPPETSSSSLSTSSAESSEIHNNTVEGASLERGVPIKSTGIDEAWEQAEWARWQKDVALWVHKMAFHPSVAASGLWLAFIGANGARARSAWANEDVIAEIGNHKEAHIHTQ